MSWFPYLYRKPALLYSMFTNTYTHWQFVRFTLWLQEKYKFFLYWSTMHSLFWCIAISVYPHPVSLHFAVIIHEVIITIIAVSLNPVPPSCPASVIPGVRVCALGLHRGSQHHAVHGHIHLPQGLGLHEESPSTEAIWWTSVHFIWGFSVAPDTRTTHANNSFHLSLLLQGFIGIPGLFGLPGPDGERVSLVFNSDLKLHTWHAHL